MLEEIVTALAPDRLLDVGCGCGHFTIALCSRCATIVAVDVERAFMARWRERTTRVPIRFGCMDGRSLGVKDGTFPLVLERAALHHVADWRRVVDEMIRVSSRHIAIEEPIDDLRSPAKRHTHEGQGLLLELQQEVGYPHYRHLDPDDVISHVTSRATVLQTRVARSDAAVSFDELFEAYDTFAARSPREPYWLDRLNRFRARLGERGFCESDTLLVVAAKR